MGIICIKPLLLFFLSFLFLECWKTRKRGENYGTELDFRTNLSEFLEQVSIIRDGFEQIIDSWLFFDISFLGVLILWFSKMGIFIFSDFDWFFFCLSLSAIAILKEEENWRNGFSCIRYCKKNWLPWPSVIILSNC